MDEYNNNFIERDNLDELLSNEEKNNKDKLKEMTDDMTNLLKCFSTEKKDISDAEISNHLFEYFNKYDRYLYSVITPYLIEMGSTQSRDNFLNRIISFYGSNEVKNFPEELRKKVLKLYDHVNLVICQNSAFYTSRKRIQNISQEAAEKAKEEINGSVQNINSQLISIVSIFVAISFVMFGGMSLLNNLFDYEGLETVPIMEMICAGSLIGIIMIMTFYLFVILIFKLTGKICEDKAPYKCIVIASCLFLTIICIASLCIIKLGNFN